MINKLKHGIVFASLFVISVMTPAFSAPQNIELNTEAVIRGKQVMKMESTFWYSPKKIKIESLIKKNASNPNDIKSTIILDSDKKIAYMLTDSTKTAIKIDINSMSNMQGANGNLNSSMLSNPQEVEKKIKEQGGKKVGTENILGYMCDVWQVNVDAVNPETNVKEKAVTKMWLSQELKLPLKVEMTSPSKGSLLSINTKKVKKNVTFSTTFFDIPKGYQITDMNEMLKQMQQQGMKQQPKK